MVGVRVRGDDHVQVLESAEVQTVPVSPKLGVNIPLGILLGLTLGVAAAMFVDFLERTTVSTPGDVTTQLGMNLVGFVPNADTDAMTPRDICLMTANHVESVAIESFRKMGVKLLTHHKGKETPVILITSSTPAEGKTTVSCNLASFLAQTGRRVILIDGDIRRPALSEVFETGSARGLYDVLVGQAKMADVVSETEIQDLRLVSAGSQPVTPMMLMDLKAMKDIMDEARSLGDVVIVDAAPILGVSEVSMMCAFCDEVLLVVEAGRHRRSIVARARDHILEVNANLTGVALNNVHYSRGDFYYYARYYRDYAY